MKNKAYHTIGTIPKSRSKPVEAKSISLTHKYMTTQKNVC